tara:strand:- start:743 stop:1018 length:276 start_codon:yes stop_codon:yes gene_type:complete
MKIFIYKTSIVIISIYLLFQFTIGQALKNYESKVESLLYNKQGREQILEKIKKEIKKANEKENLFTTEERELLSNFINKIQKELNVGESQK